MYVCMYGWVCKQKKSFTIALLTPTTSHFANYSNNKNERNCGIHFSYFTLYICMSVCLYMSGCGRRVATRQTTQVVINMLLSCVMYVVVNCRISWETHSSLIPVQKRLVEWRLFSNSFQILSDIRCQLGFQMGISRSTGSFAVHYRGVCVCLPLLI